MIATRLRKLRFIGRDAMSVERPQPGRSIVASSAKNGNGRRPLAGRPVFGRRQGRIRPIERIGRRTRFRFASWSMRSPEVAARAKRGQGRPSRSTSGRAAARSPQQATCQRSVTGRAAMHGPCPSMGTAVPGSDAQASLAGPRGIVEVRRDDPRRPQPVADEIDHVHRLPLPLGAARADRAQWAARA